MIAHVILWQPRAGLAGEERRRVLAALTMAVKGAPTVRSCRVGRRVKHGLSGYEQAMPQDFEFAAIIEFDDIDGLREYLRHPAHESIGEQFTSAAAAALAYDYEIVDLRESSLLL
jgi:stress responsive alpha/beta barrel protein